MKWYMFFINLFIFILLFIFVNRRLNKIAEEVNSIVQSKTLLSEEKKIRVIIIALFVFFFVLSSIYIFMYF